MGCLLKIFCALLGFGVFCYEGKVVGLVLRHGYDLGCGCNVGVVVMWTGRRQRLCGVGCGGVFSSDQWT
jgi:hypothetical protein